MEKIEGLPKYWYTELTDTTQKLINSKEEPDYEENDEDNDDYNFIGCDGDSGKTNCIWALSNEDEFENKPTYIAADDIIKMLSKPKPPKAIKLSDDPKELKKQRKKMMAKFKL